MLAPNILGRAGSLDACTAHLAAAAPQCTTHAPVATMRTSAVYFDGHTQRRWPVTLQANGEALLVEGLGWSRRIPPQAIVLPAADDIAPRQLQFTNGTRCELDEPEILPSLLAAVGLKPAAPDTLRRSCCISAVSLLSLAALVWSAYVWGLPLLFQATN